MLQKSERVVVKLSNPNTPQVRYISVKAGPHGFNLIEYGINALENDFDNVILLRAALEDARVPEQVLKAFRKYKRHATDVVNYHTDY